MRRRIRRRDFVNGAAASIGASLFPTLGGQNMVAVPEASPDYYPPARTGMRGSHEGSFEVAHALRDGGFWKNAGDAIDTGEEYDLVVVGGGISGLSSALFFQKHAGANCRILILDNHDDFGGHAKRNEFRQAGRMLLGYGGTFAIESPAPYSAVAQNLISELGIDVGSTGRVFDRKLYSSLGLTQGVFFDRETFGRDQLVHDPKPSWFGESASVGDHREHWRDFFDKAPLNEQAKTDLRKLYEDKVDYLQGLSSDDKKFRLARMSYARFIVDGIGLDPGVVKYLQARPHPLFGVGIDAVSAQDAWGLGMPGFDGMKLDPKPGKGMNRDAIPNEEADKYWFHFPDGNSSIARLLVRKMNPRAVPGSSAEDVVTTRTRYALLDEKGRPVRIRLNSTAVRVKQTPSDSAPSGVEVTYSRFGKLYKARAKATVLACWHVVIPYICPALPEEQKSALASAAKVPIVYTNVVIRNWRAFRKIGFSSVYAPGCFHTTMNLDLPVSIGSYHCPRSPDEPIVVHMMRTPCHPGLPAREQHRRGRMELFETSFETFERNIRDQFARTVGAGGFDPARDIAAITVNRWPHGYAYEYNSLFDRFWLEGGEQPCEVARKTFGRIAIANADAAAYAYTDAAIDQAYRAVQELVAQS